MDASPESPESADSGEASLSEVESWQIDIRGRLQGLGVRPAIAGLADSLLLFGSVCNTRDGIRVEIEGSPRNIATWKQMLLQVLPHGASIRDIRMTKIPARGFHEFRILTVESSGPLLAEVPLDTVICRDCLRDIEENSNRRFQYALTGCATCGPRYSVLYGMPYSRQFTSLNEFPLCSECQEEFDDPQDRRCHAETIACADCGPDIEYIRWQGGDECPQEFTNAESALDSGAELLSAGGILLLKGIGGYQLVCDATNETAVCRLRLAKNRMRKPLAVMVSVSDFMKNYSNGGTAVEACLSRANPIVIAEEFEVADLAASVVHGNGALGLMVPSSPLHAILIEKVRRPLVVTSGNRDGEPIEYSDESAIEDLRGVADGCLKHNRTIIRPVDDSVVRVVGGRSVTVRSGRGLAPATLPLLAQGHSLLAVGGEQKVAIVVSNGQQAVSGPHIGDLRTLESRNRYRNEVQSLMELYGCRPEVIACDLHPDYFTSQWAEGQGVRVHRVQHHHAHVAAGMLEHSLLDRTVLGVAFDGTGLGDDGTIWGGELLIATRRESQRIAGLLPFALQGGERAVREVWRIAGSLLRSAFPEWSASVVAEFLRERNRGCHERIPLAVDGYCPITSALQSEILEHSVMTSSMGRLFDGVASLVTGISRADYDGELALMLETLCDRADPGSYEFPVMTSNSGVDWIDWRPMIRQVVMDIQSGRTAGVISARFHRAVARIVLGFARTYHDLDVVISGGCFQNRILTEWILGEAGTDRSRLHLPGWIPPNDGGLSVGQYVVTTSQLFV
ncbi:MAG: carbamoyltransferase HypF [Planctomyces sp.]|nr:carbamoyltransferase HypF [Planctomyces sp.]